MKISEVSIQRPVFATMMIGALLVLGLFSYYDLNLDMYPEVDFPITTVVTVFPGASAEAVETEVTRKLEDAVNEVSGIRHITSQSREGYSLIIIEFDLETDGSQATQDVREKVAGIRSDLPEELEEPVVRQFDPMAQPIISIVVAGERPTREITEFTKNNIKKRLETVSGVGNVRLVGGEEREIQIALDPQKMESYQVSIGAVRNAVRVANMEIPGGRVDEGATEYLVRTMGRLTDVEQFNHIVIRNNEGSPVYLKDFASVRDTVEERRSLSRYNGQQAVSVRVVKQSGANTVEVARDIRAALAKLQAEVPSDIKMQIVQDNATFIEDSVHEILFNIRFGTLLAVLVIFLFLLDIRPTIITGLSIPISIVATFTVMLFMDYTINFMTLMGLSLAVGILIDDAIVVIENIYRHIAAGKTPLEAAFTGTKEIGLAVMATTLAIIAVFVPIAFMEGIVGRFFTQFGITAAVAVVISLFVAFSLTPMLSSRMLKDPRDEKNPTKKQNPIIRFLSLWNRFFDSLKPFYGRLLAASLNHRWLVLLAVIASLGAAYGAGKFVGSEFMSQTDQGKLAVDIETPPGTNLEETSARFQQVEDIVGTFNEVTGTYVTIGAGDNPVTMGRVLVFLTDKSERELSVFELIDSVRVAVQNVPGIKTTVGLGEGGHEEKPIEVSIRGPEMSELQRLARKVQDIVYNNPGATDVNNTMEEGKPEIQVTVDRNMANDLRLNLYEIPATIQTLIEGEVVTRYKEGDEEYDVRIQLDRQYRSSSDDIGRIMIEGKKELDHLDVFLVPLGRVATINTGSAIGQYNRYDRQREIRVNANALAGAFAGTITNQTMKEIGATIDVPPGYYVGTVGQAEFMEESFTNIFQALALAVIFIYLLLASLYESFFDPFSIMLSLPLSLIGAIIGLVGASFSIMSLIGIVLLMGLVTKNAILLIDFVKQLRSEGRSRTEAILEAGPIRLRPILMTTLATVFGMLPLALGLGPGAELRSPMARAVIGGIISSTVLTLVVVPVVYSLIDDFTGLFRRKKKAEPVVATEDLILDK